MATLEVKIILAKCFIRRVIIHPNEHQWSGSSLPEKAWDFVFGEWCRSGRDIREIWEIGLGKRLVREYED
jgi:hypothetical protein